MENNVIEVKFKEQKECLPLVFKSVGPAGPQGVAGKSAYEQAVEAGYTGTEEEFNSLVFNAKNYAEEAKEAAEDVNNAINQHNSSDSAHPDIRENLSRKQDDDEFHPEDYGWPDIRPVARPNSIVLLAGVKSDYSAYDNLGFAAECEGGYNVFIDGVQYGDTYASGEQCSITWSQYSATTGFSVSYPVDLIAHIVQIVPATAGNNITVFKCARVASSGTEQQGILWAHINFEHAVDVYFYTSRAVNTPLLTAVSATDNTLKINSSINFSFANCSALAYSPVLDGENRTIYGGQTFNGCVGLKKVHFKNMKLSNIAYTFYGASAFEKVIFENVDTSACTLMTAAMAKVKNLPYIDFTSATDCNGLFSGGTGEMNPFVMDVSYAKNMSRFGATGISALTNLVFSVYAPFTGASPQINLSNTGLDQAALVALFKSLPYNVGYKVEGSPTIQDGVVSGLTGNDFLRINQKSVPDMEIIIPVHTGNFSGNTENITAGNIVISRAWNKVVSAVINLSAGGTVSLSGTTVLSDNTDYWIKLTYDGNIYKVWLSTDGKVFNEEDQTASAHLYSFSQMIIGKGNQNPWPGSIDVGHMTIMLNGIPYFRGTSDMEKAINITGATGAAALTSEQLAIATDKGWTVTR